MMKRRIRMGMNTGGPTIIMIFVVLCLATLAALSLVTANADMNLTQKTADSIQEYYSADSRGEDFLSDVDSILEQTLEAPGSSLAFKDTVSGSLGKLNGVKLSESADGRLLVDYSTKINERQSLFIQLKITDPIIDPAARYSVSVWKVVNQDSWNYEDFEIEFENVVIQ